jgi:hypothetical protein
MVSRSAHSFGRVAGGAAVSFRLATGRSHSGAAVSGSDSNAVLRVASAQT